MNNRRIFLIVFSLICLLDEIVFYYIASKGRYGMACANYVYYCCGIIIFFFVIGLLLTRSSKKSNQNDGNRAEIRFNMPYAVTIAVALIAFVYYTCIFYNMKEPVGHIAVGILTGLFILLVLLNVYYGLSKKYAKNEDYMLQLLSFVGVGGLYV